LDPFDQEDSMAQIHGDFEPRFARVREAFAELFEDPSEVGGVRVSGAGGSLAFADPAAKLGFAYVMNQMQTGPYLIGPRANALVKATYECF